MSDIRFNRWLHQSGTGGVSQDSSGHIGIGTTVPTMALDVRGDVNIGNTININNASGIISATTFTGTTGTFSGNVSAVDGTFTGDVTIAGTLTYEDVANIDAVGIITAQSDIIVGGGLTVTGISTFNNDVKLLDNDKLKFGIGEDLQIYHDGSNSYIKDVGTGILQVNTNYFQVKNADDNEFVFQASQNGPVSLYYNNVKKFETTNNGAVVTGILTATTFSGNLTGNVTGDLTGNLAGISSIAAISSSISDTAVDVFVYDTRKDSDGGAWRKRTQHTSWYNETLNTATRGSRKEFPAVAVLVLSANKLTIYDGDDPDLPMWMEAYQFVNGGNGGTTTNWHGGSGTFSSVAASNGIIICGASGGCRNLHFVNDRMSLFYTPASGNYTQRGGISDRNDAYSSWDPSDNYYAQLVSASTNDVAMAVLPNAPIDDATGLPVPTIAVATDGGVSIIKDDGTVVSKTTTQLYSNTLNSTYYHKNIDISGENAIVNYEYAGGGGHGQLTVVTLNDLTALRRYGRDYTNTTSSHPYFQPIGSRHRHFPKQIYKNNYIFTREQNDSAINGASDGILTIYEDQSTPSNGLINRISSSYNTGWMHGDVKGAFLSDTDATNATNSNVVTNGTFDSNTNGWSGDSGASVSWDSGGFASVNYGGGANDKTFAIQQTGILVSGAKYRITGRVQPSMTGTYEFRVRAGGSGTQWNITSGLTNGQWYSFDTGIITADGTKLEIGSHGGTISNFYLDDVYVWKLEEEDRSVNNTGLEVHGTVTKSAVATGAELVAYSGFSGSNVLVQPYNSDLNPGTGDYSFMLWFKCSSTSGEQMIMRRFGVPTVTGGMMMRIVSSTSVLQWYVRDTSSSATSVQSPSAVDNGAWHCAVGTRQGSTANLYLDGVLVTTQTCSANSHDPGTTADLVIGAEEVSASPGTYQNPADLCSLTLVRYSLSAPSAAQVKKMYEDEKVLFQENTKATLYGSSNNVTALGYDEDTKLLHAGTSAGRSDFQGLRRINNTTTAVTTAISASDDLIAEQ